MRSPWWKLLKGQSQEVIEIGPRGGKIIGHKNGKPIYLDEREGGGGRGKKRPYIGPKGGTKRGTALDDKRAEGPKPKKDAPKDEPKPKGDASAAVDGNTKDEVATPETARARIERIYKLRLDEGFDDKQAKQLSDNIEGAADLCKINPPVCTGNLGIPRRYMPQFENGKVVKAFIDRLQSKGVKVQKKEEHVGKMMATQQEIYSKKVYGDPDADNAQDKGGMLAGYRGGWTGIKNDIVMSRDGYILDGHHRWAALLSDGTDGANNTMNVIKVDLDIGDLLNEAMSDPQVKVRHVDAKGNETTTDDAKTIATAKKEVAGYVKKARGMAKGRRFDGFYRDHWRMADLRMEQAYADLNARQAGLAGCYMRLVKAQYDLFGAAPVVAVGKRGGRITGYDAKGNPIYGGKRKRPPSREESFYRDAKRHGFNVTWGDSYVKDRGKYQHQVTRVGSQYEANVIERDSEYGESLHNSRHDSFDAAVAAMNAHYGKATGMAEKKQRVSPEAKNELFRMARAFTKISDNYNDAPGDRNWNHKSAQKWWLASRVYADVGDGMRVADAVAKHLKAAKHYGDYAASFVKDAGKGAQAILDGKGQVHMAWAEQAENEYE